jgi:hypothetical protein
MWAVSRDNRYLERAIAAAEEVCLPCQARTSSHPVAMQGSALILELPAQLGLTVSLPERLVSCVLVVIVFVLD